MSGILLTQYNGAILGPIAKVLGLLMEGIFNVLNIIGIPNIGLSIIIFTIVIYLLLMPLTFKQQKFSKLSAKMNPEIQAIQAKYKNKKDMGERSACYPTECRWPRLKKFLPFRRRAFQKVS